MLVKVTGTYDDGKTFDYGTVETYPSGPGSDWDVVMTDIIGDMDGSANSLWKVELERQ